MDVSVIVCSASDARLPETELSQWPKKVSKSNDILLVTYTCLQMLSQVQHEAYVSSSNSATISSKTVTIHKCLKKIKNKKLRHIRMSTQSKSGQWALVNAKWTTQGGTAEGGMGNECESHRHLKNVKTPQLILRQDGLHSRRTHTSLGTTSQCSTTHCKTDRTVCFRTDALTGWFSYLLRAVILFIYRSRYWCYFTHILFSSTVVIFYFFRGIFIIG